MCDMKGLNLYLAVQLNSSKICFLHGYIIVGACRKCILEPLKQCFKSCRDVFGLTSCTMTLVGDGIVPSFTVSALNDSFW